jgi:tetratricopeptide (TPR) repeat protein
LRSKLHSQTAQRFETTCRGLAYYYLEDYDRALLDYNEAIRIDPDETGIYRNRGNLYEAMSERFASLAKADREKADQIAAQIKDNNEE